MNNLVLPVVLPLLAAFLMQPLARLSGILARLLGPLVLLVGLVLLLQLWFAPETGPFTVALGGFAATTVRDLDCNGRRSRKGEVPVNQPV